MMMEKGSEEWRKLTFSQREGYVPLPEALQVGKLTKKFRNYAWFYIKGSINRGVFFDVGSYYFNIGDVEGMYWRDFISLYRFKVHDVTHDEDKISGVLNSVEWIKNLIFVEESHEVLTFLEYILRSPDIPKLLATGIEHCFEFAPYFIDSSSEPTIIVPATSTEAKESIQQSLDNINQSNMNGSKSHLHKAAQALNKEDFPAAIRESIHAVESVARKIDPEASKALTPALNSLQKHGILKHSAFNEAFKNSMPTQVMRREFAIH